jgi:hypothetical protein
MWFRRSGLHAAELHQPGELQTALDAQTRFPLDANIVDAR